MANPTVTNHASTTANAPNRGIVVLERPAVAVSTTSTRPRSSCE